MSNKYLIILVLLISCFIFTASELHAKFGFDSKIDKGAVVKSAGDLGNKAASPGPAPAVNPADKGQTSIPPPTQSQDKAQQNKNALVAVMPATDTYVYKGQNRPDPFKPFMELNPQPQTAKKIEKPLSIYPLQRLDVSAFNLVGIAGTDRQKVAMVEDPANKKFYPLFVGTYIGLNNGKVAEILSNKVIVEEQIAVKKGKYQTKKILMQLRKDEVSSQETFDIPRSSDALAEGKKAKKARKAIKADDSQSLQEEGKP